MFLIYTFLKSITHVKPLGRKITYDFLIIIQFLILIQERITSYFRSLFILIICLHFFSLQVQVFLKKKTAVVALRFTF